MNLTGPRHTRAVCCLLIAMLISACADAPPSPTPVVTPSARAQLPGPTAAPTSAPSYTAAPTAASSPTLAPAEAAGPTSTSANAAFQPGPCTFQAWVVVETTCGTLTVPEDHQQPHGRQIKLAVAILKSSADHPAPDPVVFLQGGPGLSVLTNRPELYMPDFYALLASRDVILLEQRGVGLSQPALDCPEMAGVDAVVAQQGLRGRTDPGPYLQPALACRDRLIKAGVNLADYNTSQGASDVAALRQALGYAQWNLFGVSYGTRLALTVMRDFPAGVRSAVLDSPLPPQVSVARPANIAAALDQLFAACAVDTACNHAYPNLKGVFYDLVARLNQAPVQRSLGQDRQVTITGDAFMAAVAEALAATTTIPHLPKAIYAARAGDFIGLFPFGAPPAVTFSMGLFYSVWCSEEVLVIGQDQLAAADNALPQLHHLFSQLGDLGICRQWGVPAALTSARQPAQSAIPSLILSGQVDPTTPPAYAAETARTLQHSYLFTFPGQSHAVSHEPCAMTLAAAFVTHPDASPAAACFATLTGPAWDVGP